MIEVAMIALPILFIVIGTLGALSFAPPSDETFEQLEANAAEEANRATAELAQSINFAQPLTEALNRPMVQETEVPVEAMLADVEERLRRDRLVAKHYLRNPAENSLWMN